MYNLLWIQIWFVTSQVAVGSKKCTALGTIPTFNLQEHSLGGSTAMSPVKAVSSRSGWAPSAWSFILMHGMKAAGSKLFNQTSVASYTVLQCSTCIAQKTESSLFLLSHIKKCQHYKFSLLLHNHCKLYLASHHLVLCLSLMNTLLKFIPLLAGPSLANTDLRFFKNKFLHYCEIE